MRKILETGIILFSAMGFWGMIYPDLCFTEDVCEVVWEEEEDAEGESGIGEGACGDKAGTKNSRPKAGTKGGIIGTGASGSVTGTDTNNSGDMFTRICLAEPGQIRIKSKFLEAIGLDKLLQ